MLKIAGQKYRNFSTLGRNRFDKAALIEFSDQVTVKEIFRFGIFSSGILLLEPLQQTRDTADRRIGRNGKIGLDHGLVTLLEHLPVVGPEIFTHGFQRKVLVLLATRGAFDVGAQKSSHRIL